MYLVKFVFVPYMCNDYGLNTLINTYYNSGKNGIVSSKTPNNWNSWNDWHKFKGRRNTFCKRFPRSLNLFESFQLFQLFRVLDYTGKNRH